MSWKWHHTKDNIASKKKDHTKIRLHKKYHETIDSGGGMIASYYTKDDTVKKKKLHEKWHCRKDATTQKTVYF